MEETGFGTLLSGEVCLIFRLGTVTGSWLTRGKNETGGEDKKEYGLGPSERQGGDTVYTTVTSEVRDKGNRNLQGGNYR